MKKTYCVDPIYPYDKIELKKLKINNEKPSPLHNNCSGKHLGFLTIAQAISKKS